LEAFLMEGVGDRRTRQTKAALTQSLLTLLRERPLNRITVKELCALADVNRSTFYAHYTDTAELLRQIQEEFFAELLASLRRYDTLEATRELVSEIVGRIPGHIDLCRVLFSDYGDRAFLRRVMYIAHDQSLEAWGRHSPDAQKAQLELMYAFVANGSVGLLEAWIRGGLREDPQEIAGLINHLAYRGLARFLRNAAGGNRL
jgi:AcrR family transcriptional regulator